jgi:AraC-like DNA-binding protein
VNPTARNGGHLGEGSMREPASRLVGAFTAVPALIRQLGVDPPAVLAAAGIAPGLLDDPSRRIAYEDLLRLLRLAAERTACPHFGLLVGRPWHLPDIGLLGELMRNSPTVATALRELVVHHHLNSEGALGFVLERDGFVDLGYAVYLPFSESTAQLYDGVLAATVNFMRDLCGDAWSPTAVFLSHSAPADVEPYRRCFQAPLHFDADHCALRFRRSWLTHRVAGASSQRLRRAKAEVLAVGEATLVERVHRALRTLLLHGKSTGADVARSLSIHRRTLDRRLLAEGTTFQQVLDRVRFAVAKELLEDSGIGLPDIAVALGYADDVALIRAFRRWTGTTPGAWRRSAR